MGAIRILHGIFAKQKYGAETVILRLFRYIDRSRYQFDFLVPYNCREVDYETEVESLGGHVYRQYYHFTEKKLPGYLSPEDLWKIHPEIQGWHFNSSYYGVCNTQLMVAAQKIGLPIRIIHAHNSAAPNYRKEAQHLALRPFAQQYANRLLACSKEAGSWHFPRKQFEVFPNAVDAAMFAFNETVRNRIRKEAGVDNKLTIGYVGRLVKQKNPKFLLDILREVNRRCDYAHLVLVGDGYMEDDVRHRAQEMGLENISFAGRVENVNEWMQGFDVLLLPSRFEGLGVVLIEAQASGLPCFASDQVPVEAAVTNRLTYLSLKEPAEWADAILRADFTYDRNRGYDEVVAAGYDIRESAKRLEAIYDELLARQGK